MKNTAFMVSPYDDIGYREIDVHGGLTYSDFCQEGPEEESICHIPEPGAPDKVWWFGFDCNHAGDYNPSEAFFNRDPSYYRTVEYVKYEIRKLALYLRDNK